MTLHYDEVEHETMCQKIIIERVKCYGVFPAEVSFIECLMGHTAIFKFITVSGHCVKMRARQSTHIYITELLVRDDAKRFYGLYNYKCYNNTIILYRISS